MKKSTSLSLALLGAVGATLISGCVTRERVVYRQAPPPAVVSQEDVVQSPPPPPIVETVAVSPGPAYVWVGGNWVWRGHWAWERGHWALPPRAGVVWVPHRYEYRGGVHVFVRGGWR